jgi:hypothetical protein
MCLHCCGLFKDFKGSFRFKGAEIVLVCVAAFSTFAAAIAARFRAAGVAPPPPPPQLPPPPPPPPGCGVVTRGDVRFAAKIGP